MPEIRAKDWQEIKNFIDSRSESGNLNFLDRESYYEVIATDGHFSLILSLSKNPADTTDLDDFVNNYKPYANKPLGNAGVLGKENIIDAFGRFRVSTPKTLFSSYYVNEKKDILFDTKTSGSGQITKNSDTNNIELTVGSSSGDLAVRQSKEYIHYIPGQSYKILLSGKFGTGKANCVQRIGYFDDNDGLFFEYDGTDVNLVLRSSTSGSITEQRISQSNWNGDKLDGTGPSKITLSPENPQIFVLNFQWLGAGRVRFGFNIHGTDVYVHTLEHANEAGVAPYMRAGNLPARFEIENTAITSGSTTLENTCISVVSEGDSNISLIKRTVNTGTNSKSVGIGSEVPIISLRLNPTNNRATIIPKITNALATTNDDVLIRVRLNGSLTGASWTDVPSSIAQYDVSASAISGGLELDSAYISKKGSSNLELSRLIFKLVSNLEGTPDILTLTAEAVTTSSEVLGSISYEELS